MLSSTVIVREINKIRIRELRKYWKMKMSIVSISNVQYALKCYKKTKRIK